MNTIQFLVVCVAVLLTVVGKYYMEARHYEREAEQCKTDLAKARKEVQGLAETLGEIKNSEVIRLRRANAVERAASMVYSNVLAHFGHTHGTLEPFMGLVRPYAERGPDPKRDYMLDLPKGFAQDASDAALRERLKKRADDLEGQCIDPHFNGLT